MTSSQRQWLHSSIGESVAPVSRGHGFKPRWSSEFFRLPYAFEKVAFITARTKAYMNTLLIQTQMKVSHSSLGPFHKMIFLALHMSLVLCGWCLAERCTSPMLWSIRFKQTRLKSQKNAIVSVVSCLVIMGLHRDMILRCNCFQRSSE